MVHEDLNFIYPDDVHIRGGCGFTFRGEFMYFGGSWNVNTHQAELTGRAILIGGQTSDMHVTAKLEP